MNYRREERDYPDAERRFGEDRPSRSDNRVVGYWDTGGGAERDYGWQREHARTPMGWGESPSAYAYQGGYGGEPPQYLEGRDRHERIPDWEHHPWYPGPSRHESRHEGRHERDHEHQGFLSRMFGGRKIGRGPKNYTRSDERIREEICERLVYSDSIDCADVSIEVRDGNAILEGTVPDRRMKHAIEDLVERSYGVKEIENRIRVNRPQAREYVED